MPRKRPNRETEGPLVPIVTDRLDSAWKTILPNVGSSEMARRVGRQGVSASRTTLHRLRIGKLRSCRMRVAHALASELGPPVTVPWLSGESELEWPGTSARYLGREDSPSMEGQFDLNQRPSPGTKWDQVNRRATEFLGLPVEQRGPCPPAYEILAWRLARDIEAARYWWETGKDAPSYEWPFRKPNPEVELEPLHIAPVIRALLSVTFVRRFLHAGTAPGIITEADCEEYARFVDGAARVALRNFLDRSERITDDQIVDLLRVMARIGRAASAITTSNTPAWWT